MANLDFYASRDDLLELLGFILRETDCRVFESYSRFDHELREFTSVEHLDAAFELGTLPPVKTLDRAALLQLWSPSSAGEVIVQRIDLKPGGCPPHTFRYRAEGWGLMQLYLGGVRDRVITHSHFGHNSETRARNWSDVLAKKLGPVSAWNWSQLLKVSRTIRYHIGSRRKAGKAGSRPILQAAHALVLEGYTSK